MSTTPRAGEEKRPSTPKTVPRAPRRTNEDILDEIIRLFMDEHPNEGVDAFILDIEQNGDLVLTPEEEENLRNEFGDIPRLRY